MRVGIRSALAMVALAVTFVGSGAALSAAQAATPACGSACVTPFSLMYGKWRVPAVQGGVQAAGTPVVLARPSSQNADEDFIVDLQGTVPQLYADGYLSQDFESVFASQGAEEFEYAPDGVPSDLCAGVPRLAQDGSPVDLEPCHAANTIWVIDAGEFDVGATVYHPLVDGASPATPLSVEAAALTDFLPGGRLFTWREFGLLKAGGEFADQMWSLLSG